MPSLQLIRCLLLFLLEFAGGLCVEGNGYEWSQQAGIWLKYHAEPTTWEDARLSCYGEDATLASPLTYQVKEAIETLVRRQKSSSEEKKVTSIFIGVHATFSRGDYSSIEGVPMQRLAITWGLGEPDNVDNLERCLSMSILGCHSNMADTRCDFTLPYVCYRRNSKPPKLEKVYRVDYEWNDQAGGWLKYHVIPATRGDASLRCHAEGAIVAFPSNQKMCNAIENFVQKQGGSMDQEGVTIFVGVDDAMKESDNSQRCLAMTVRYNYGTMMSYTRCGNVLPYVCYKKEFVFTLTNCGTIDSEYVLVSETGSCYKFHMRGLTWSEAYMTCVAEGGYLAIINNDVEAEVIKSIMSKYPTKDIDAKYTDTTLIGFHDWGHFGSKFMTIHGESLEHTYSTWRSGEPNNSSATLQGEFCGSIIRDGELNDIDCIGRYSFICEKSPNSLLNNDLEI